MANKDSKFKDNVDISWASDRDWRLLLFSAIERLEGEVKNLQIEILKANAGMAPLPRSYDADTNEPQYRSSHNPVPILQEYIKAHKLALQLKAKLDRASRSADAEAIAELFGRR